MADDLKAPTDCDPPELFVFVHALTILVAEVSREFCQRRCIFAPRKYLGDV